MERGCRQGVFQQQSRRVLHPVRILGFWRPTSVARHPILVAQGSSSSDSSSSAAAPQGMMLKEQLRQALLAEAEEERRGQQRGSGAGVSHTACREVSLYGRLYSEILWKVTCSHAQNSVKRDSSVAFFCGGSNTGDCVEGSIVEYSGVGEMVVAVNADDSKVLSSWNPQERNISVVFGWNTNSVALERQLKAVECLSSRMEGQRKEARALRAILLGSSQAVSLACQTPEWMTSPNAVGIVKKSLGELQNLNDGQKRAIASALTRSMTLWQGPPGTGKTRTLLGLTHVLTSLVRESRMLKSKIGTILAIAETNAAADNLIAGMNILEISCCRVGPVSRVRPELRHLTLEAQAEASPAGRKASSLRDRSTQLAIEAKKLRDSGVLGALVRAQELEFESQRLWNVGAMEMNEAMERIMADCDVVVSTCISAGDAKLQGYDFRVVIVDEATQATEPSTLVAITRGAECLVMAGDHAQLPPTVLSKKAEKLGLNISLFARMQNLGIPSQLLSIQYRMHPNINEFPSQEFYGGKVSTGIHASSRPPVPALLDSSLDHIRVRFIECDGVESRASEKSGGFSYSNQAQCDMALMLVRLVLDDSSVKSCVLLTPYNGHLELLRRSLSQEYQDLVDSGWLIISTVDGFQGREADVVILCTVRSNDKGSVGFVKDPRRMNVAITRARRNLVVIGSKATLSNDPTWRKWLQWVEEQS